MNMHTVRGSAASRFGLTSPSPELAHMLSSEPLPGEVMEPQSQPLSSSFPCSAANGRREPKQPSSSPERGDARPKPPVKPKPCVLPKPAVPVKPPPGQRQTLSEVPSAEKINLLAGPKPYSSGAVGAVKRLSFSLKCPPKEATNGKEVPSPFSTTVNPCGGDGGAAGPARESAAVEGTSGGESCTVRKSAVPFKVKPVPVAAKPERFPGTTVEEILAKIEKPSKEGPNSPDRPRLVRSFFSQDGGTAVHLGPKGYATFRRNSSGGERGGTEAEDPVYRDSCEAEDNRLSRDKEETTSSNGQPAPDSEQPARAIERNSDFLSRDSSSSRPSVSCDGGRLGHSSPSSHPGTYQPLSEFTPGSPCAAAEAAQAPGSPYFPAAISTTEAQLPPGSPDVLPETIRSPVCSSLSLTQSPGSPPALPDPLPPEYPKVLIKTSTGHSLSSAVSDLSGRDPDVSLLPWQPASSTHVRGDRGSASPQNLLQMSESPGSPSTPSEEYPVSSDRPPGSPTDKHVLSGDQDPIENQEQMLFLNEDPQLSKLGLRRASEGVVQPRHNNTARDQLGGSLAVLPSGGGHPLEHSLGGESNWSLSQSFEWSFPSQPIERKLGPPPQSPIQEAEDTVLLETELGGETLRLKGASEETSQEANRRGEEEEPEALRCSSYLRDSSDGQTEGKESESPSGLKMSGPGGPSVQKEPASLKLMSPVGTAEAWCQEEEGDGFSPFPPIHEEGALRIMEPLSSVEKAAPPAETCILFSEDAQMKMAASCQEEEEDTLGLAQEGKAGHADLLKGVEPHPGSHWLDELLASPPPSADDVKRRGLPKLENPLGPEDLLGWSRKDLHSEFGIVEANKCATFDVSWASDISKVDWPSETEQDREFGPGTQDWPTSYNVGDTKRQDVEFGACQQDWTKGTPLLGSSSPEQEEWLAAYSSSCSDLQVNESDWSSTYSISTAECQEGEPYVRKPGWPKLCTGDDDQGNMKHATEETGWSSHYPADAVEKSSWSNICSVETAGCPEPEVNTNASTESSKGATGDLQETKLSTGHSGGSSDALEVISHSDTVSGCESVRPSESSAGCRAKQPQAELPVSQLEQLSEYSSSTPESQGSIQQQPRPATYGLEDSCSQEHIWNVKQSDWPNKYDLGVAQTSGGNLSVEKTDASSEHEGGQAGWEKELSERKQGNTTVSESDVEFCAQSPVWADDYSLRKPCPQVSNFSTGTRDWVKDTNASGTEQKELFGAKEEDRAGIFGSVDFPDQRVMVNLEATSDSQMDQSGNLRTMGGTECRGVGEGQREWSPILGFRHMDLSSDLETGNPDTATKSTEKECQSSFALEAEETRKPGVGQADFNYPSGIESMDVSDLRSETLNVTEKVDPVQMDCPDASLVEHEDYSCHLRATGLGSDVMQHPRTSGGSIDRKFHSQRLSSPSRLLEEMVSQSAAEDVIHQKRPISFPSCHSEGEKGLGSFPDAQVLADEKSRGLPSTTEDGEKDLFDVNGGSSHLDSGNESQSYLEAKELCQLEENGSQAVSQEDQASEGADILANEDFIFLEDTEVLDNTVFRDRAHLGRKRGHRAPATRSAGALSESDRDSWMFRDSTEPRRAFAASDEEVQEEPKSRKSRSSPLSKGVKVPLFPGLSPSALKAKLRGRNRSAEEGDPQSEAKEAQVQRSKSCKISGKPLVLPPKPEKTAGSETSSPNWLQVLKLKKKKP
ncbi:hypothetical protein JRQ81_000115 [Phrynocephalus forsythii]|uniref:Tankyrase 1-binding protein C-terminal domain-containing protein n=1 Tax=Phrynocephalus forsythii TaxID=171643 RepID=A0A9Q0Y4N3_9SAUR|nr:hypothetical protein JRQ81_000115 [Phrynocephalus forsythii]